MTVCDKFLCFMQINPKHRASAAECLQHPWLSLTSSAVDGTIGPGTDSHHKGANMRRILSVEDAEEKSASHRRHGEYSDREEEDDEDRLQYFDSKHNS